MSKSNDPVPLSEAMKNLTRQLGIPAPEQQVTVDQVWPEVVGPVLAQHARVRSIRNGDCVVEVDGPAWATQLRLLSGKLIKNIAAEVGDGVVKKLYIHGPAAPSWSRGPRRVRGRGPRDTYG